VSKGKLKIFLGYAAGTGKTYQMLTAAQELKAAGSDVVIGYFEPHGRAETIAKTEGLEFVARLRLDYRGSVFEEMDTDALIKRNPQVAVVDEFAHTNVPGSARLKRWQDVLLILESGIDVLTSLNIQHIESLNDQVWHVSGVRVRETVPDWLLGEAAEVVMVDVTPRALIHRMERGVVYSPEKARAALENFFTETNLSALRELALRQTAHQIEERRGAGPIATVGNAKPVVAVHRSEERLMLWLTPHPATAMLIRRGRRVADYLGCPCTAAYAESSEQQVEQHINFCRNLRIEANAIPCGEPAKALAAYARARGVTQIYVTRHTPDLTKLVNQVRDMQVVIVSERIRSMS
jgi:two-component system sensor histidine kinase KdpD